MLASDALDMLVKFDIVLAFCEKKRQLLVNSWPTNPVPPVVPETKNKK